MRVTMLLLRVLVTGCAAASAGCINLPASVERELACPPAGADSHFGEPGECV
jgi:hypothetical protein